MPVQMLRYNLSLAADGDSMQNVFGGVIPCTQGACSLCKLIVGISNRWKDHYFCWQMQRTEGKRRACDPRNSPCTGTPILCSCLQGAAYCLLWDSAYLTPTDFPGSNQEDNTGAAAKEYSLPSLLSPSPSLWGVGGPKGSYPRNKGQSGPLPPSVAHQDCSLFVRWSPTSRSWGRTL